MAHDIVVIGAGISGLAFAAHAARAGRSVLLLEGREQAGGCVATRGGRDGFWIELGAHTLYNSYGATLELLELAGIAGELQPRGKAVLRFLDGDDLAPGKNLGALLRRMSLWELLKSLPGAFRASPRGQSAQAYYSRLVGAGNYQRVLGPMLSAVTSQPVDDFPADLLFKKRARRKDIRRSFTLRGGLGTATAAIARLPGVTVATGRRALRLRSLGGGYLVDTADGGSEPAATVALAVPPGAAATLLEGPSPAAAAAAAAVREASVDSTGVVLRTESATLPYATFFIPRADSFYSVVTRDVVPDATWRGLVFHFKPGASLDARLDRIAAVLHLARKDLEHVVEQRHVLPSPATGHAGVVADLDRALAGTRLAVTGNWFGGLSIEDCVLRSRAEWQRVAG